MGGLGYIVINKKTAGRPAFHITFNIKDLPLAYELLKILAAKRGRVQLDRRREEQNCCILQIHSIDGLTYIVNLINGKLRTSKAYQISLIINWLNKKHNAKIQQLPKSNVVILDDGWLAGFTYADGNFYVRYTIKGNPIKARVEPRYYSSKCFIPKLWNLTNLSLAQ
jgi:hypothetical protein